MTTTDSARVLLPPSLAFERYGADGEVGVLRLSRTAKRNALDDATVLGPRGVLHRARPTGVGAVVLDAEGEHFSAGLDLSELAERDALAGRAALADVAPRLRPHRVRHAARDLGAQGRRGRRRAGAGLRHAPAGRRAQSAFYALPEGQRGLFVGGGGSVRVPRLIGAHRMADMMLTGRVLTRAGGPRRSGSRTTSSARARAWRKALELAGEDRDELAGHQLRRAAGAAADRRRPARDEGFLLESLMAAVAGEQRRGQDADAGVPGGPRGEGAAVDEQRRCATRHAMWSRRRPTCGRPTRIGRFLTWLERERGAATSPTTTELHRWSVDGPGRVLVGDLGVLRASVPHARTRRCSGGREMPGRELVPRRDR